MNDNNTKSGNIGGHCESQDGHRVLNNTKLNHIYHNEGVKLMNNHLLILKVQIGQTMLCSLVSMRAIVNSEFTKSHKDGSVSSMDSLSSKS